MFDLMVDGKNVEAKTEWQQQMVQRFSDIMLCKTFNRTPQIIADLPQDFYEDLILVLQKQAAKNQRDQIAMQKGNK